MVTPLGLGPRTPKLKAWCSDQLSYGAIYPFVAAKEIWLTAVFFRSKQIFIFSSKNNYQGTQQFKLLDSHQIRQALICCIFEINGLEVHF